MTVSTVKSFNKSILLEIAGLDKLRCNTFFLAPAGNVDRSQFAPLSRQMTFSKVTISSRYSMTRTTRAAGKVSSTSMASTSRLDGYKRTAVIQGVVHQIYGVTWC